ncbi:MAG: DUF262 domain-containing protein [Cyanobacteria bacterium P01_C01_bin.121]
MVRNVAGRLSTDTKDISDLVADIRNGEAKIPKFQRPFVWHAEQALNLLDSIANSYPIGSLLLWKTADKLIAERDIGNFRLPETPDLTPTLYVLDGQQRLTVIYSCLGAAPNDGGFAAGYDLIAEEFIELPQDVPLHIFPLRIAYDTPLLLNYRTALQAHPKHQELQPRLDAIISAVTKYKIPVVTLRDLTVTEVCPIFERINSSGTRLSTYDLMVAATWSEEFDLDDEAATIADSLTPKGFGDVDGNTVLKCLSAVHLGSVKKEDILSLRTITKAEMQALVESTRSALLKAIDLLSTEFGIYSWDFLPYEALIVILSALYVESSTLTSDQVRRTKQWFWRSAFSQRYRGASESYISRDIDIIKTFVIYGGDAREIGDVPSARVLTTTAFRSNNSRARAFILALAKVNPRNVTNGASIDTAEALSGYNKKQYHHIHPRAHLRRIEAPGEHNSLANICMLAAAENRAVSDADPNVYLPACLTILGDSGSEVFASNLMPSPNENDYSAMPFAEFMQRRAEVLRSHIATLCDGD